MPWLKMAATSVAKLWTGSWGHCSPEGRRDIWAMAIAAHQPCSSNTNLPVRSPAASSGGGTCQPGWAWPGSSTPAGAAPGEGVGGIRAVSSTAFAGSSAEQRRACTCVRGLPRVRPLRWQKKQTRGCQGQGNGEGNLCEPPLHLSSASSTAVPGHAPAGCGTGEGGWGDIGGRQSRTLACLAHTSRLHAQLQTGIISSGK